MGTHRPPTITNMHTTTKTTNGNAATDAALDFPTEQLVELMSGVNQNTRKMAEKIARKNRGWKKSDWAMPMLAAFQLEVDADKMKKGYKMGVVASFSLSLKIGDDVVRYIVRSIEYRSHGIHRDFSSITRVWTRGGNQVIEHGAKWAQTKLQDPATCMSPTTHSESIADTIQTDWVAFWNANFRTSTCSFR